MDTMIDAYELDFLEMFSGYEVGLFNLRSGEWCCFIKKRIKGGDRTIYSDGLISLADILEGAENALKKEFAKADD